MSVIRRFVPRVRSSFVSAGALSARLSSTPLGLAAALLAASPLACAGVDDASDPVSPTPIMTSPASPEAPSVEAMPGATPPPMSSEASSGGDQTPLTPPAPSSDEVPGTNPTPPAEPSSDTVVIGRVSTATVDDYEDAPASPDPDDPAIWLDPNGSGAVLILGTLKEAGMLVFDVEGRVLQTIAPPNRPLVSAEDPFTPIGVGSASAACPGSVTGEDFGRFNNVHVQQGFELTGPDAETRTIDIAVVSDRGCDNLRIYEIVPGRAEGPLIDITSSDAPRLFPTRFQQPSPIQSPGEASVEVDNPLGDSNTAYGMTTFRLDEDAAVNVLVSQNNRGVIGQFELLDTGDGTVSYDPVREFRFDPVFDVPGIDGQVVAWSPCREEVDEDLQFEGLIVDAEEGVLYAAQEVVGIWRVSLDEDQPDVVTVPDEALFERTLDFGKPFFAIPNEDGELTCELSEPADLPIGTVAGPGSSGAGGEHLAADVEGLAIYDAGDGEGYLIASSQGDNTFHVYDRRDVTEHLGTFQVEGAGETDGHEVISLPLGSQFPFGALIIQNGGAEPPANVSPINGFEYDGSGNFIFVRWEDIAAPLNLTVADPDAVLGSD